MIAFNGYFDEKVIHTLENIDARKNQRVIITLLDKEIQINNKDKKMSAAVLLTKYANMNYEFESNRRWGLGKGC